MADRTTMAAQLAGRPVDLCVIGGGATGAGCALDAQLRGLDTVLVEAADFASGASSASTKMVHGGVRYLQEAVNSLDFRQYRLVRDALRERIHMLRNAPHLTRALEFVIPCASQWERFYYGAGVKIYDWIAGSGRLIPSGVLTRDAAARKLPALNRSRSAGAVTYSDGQFDDARYCLALVDSFIDAGGLAMNYARVTDFERDSAGKITAASIEDKITGAQIRVGARAFVNATGPYSDAVRQLASAAITPRMRPSKGVHILFPLEEFPDDAALLVPKTEDGRVIFAIPWQGRLLVGTTDDPAPASGETVVTREDVDYLLRQLNPYLAKPLRARDIVGAFVGIRPLVSSGHASQTKQLIRDDEVEVDTASGLISILGGKWTTYRLMAERTIDEVARFCGKSLRPCRTRDYPLSGSQEFAHASDPTARHLASKYGRRSAEVMELVREDAMLAAPLAEGHPCIRAQVVWAARREMAFTVEDVLARRIGLQFHSWSNALDAAETTAQLLGRELHWSDAEIREAAEKYAVPLRKTMQELIRE